MRRLMVAMLASAMTSAVMGQPAATDPPDQSWIEHSNTYTNQLLEVQLQHSPERGTQQGVAKYDERISDPSLVDEMAERHELEAVLKKVDVARTRETDKRVQEDLQILHKAFDLQFRQQDYSLQHELPFYNASQIIFQGLRTLLDDQVTPERRAAAVVRLRKYTGLEPGFHPTTELLKQRGLEQIAKPGVLYPSKDQLETEIGRNSSYVSGIADLFKKYKLSGWEPGYAKLKEQLAAYDAWVREDILPKARTDFRLPREKYALAFEGFGFDLPPA